MVCLFRYYSRPSRQTKQVSLGLGLVKILRPFSEAAFDWLVPTLGADNLRHVLRLHAAHLHDVRGWDNGGWLPPKINEAAEREARILRRRNCLC